jgi:hypothetical protein
VDRWIHGSLTCHSGACETLEGTSKGYKRVTQTLWQGVEISLLLRCPASQVYAVTRSPWGAHPQAFLQRAASPSHHFLREVFSAPSPGTCSPPPAISCEPAWPFKEQISACNCSFASASPHPSGGSNWGPPRFTLSVNKKGQSGYENRVEEWIRMWKGNRRGKGRFLFTILTCFPPSTFTYQASLIWDWECPQPETSKEEVYGACLLQVDASGDDSQTVPCLNSWPLFLHPEHFFLIKNSLQSYYPPHHLCSLLSITCGLPWFENIK